jgi:hypothetical protein
MSLMKLWTLLLLSLVTGFLSSLVLPPLEPVVNPTTQASSLSLQHFPNDV